MFTTLYFNFETIWPIGSATRKTISPASAGLCENEGLPTSRACTADTKRGCSRVRLIPLRPKPPRGAVAPQAVGLLSFLGSPSAPKLLSQIQIGSAGTTYISDGCSPN